MTTIWVLSFANSGNFGDRLGVQMLAHLLPPSATVRHIFHDPWDAPAGETPDLLVLGAGNSVFAPILTPALLDLVARTPRVVGVFGTQFHDLMPLDRLAQLLSNVDVWFARSRDDLDRYGAMARDARHLGDWLVDAFPMAEPRSQELLKIPSAALDVRAPLDRHITMIQHYANVLSPRLHPLLCALTSARKVAYNEQHVVQPDRRIPSGKFAALLSDIFGEAPPPDVPFAVNREAVVRYKTLVRGNIRGLSDALAVGLPA